MTDQALDKLARRLMLDAARLEYGEVLEGRQEHVFSPAFERRMRKLLRRGRHPVLYRALRAAACLLLALLLSGCAVLAVSPEIREAFEGWVRSVYYDTLVYTYTGPQGESPKNMLYRPLWLPEGYEVYDESPNLSLPMASYRNEAEEDITLITYGSVESMSLNIVRDEDVVEKQVLVAGKKADLYLDSGGGSNFLIWTDDEKHLIFVLMGHFTEEEALRIAESVRLMPLRTPPIVPAGSRKAMSTAALPVVRPPLRSIMTGRTAHLFISAMGRTAACGRKYKRLWRARSLRLSKWTDRQPGCTWTRRVSGILPGTAQSRGVVTG